MAFEPSSRITSFLPRLSVCLSSASRTTSGRVQLYQFSMSSFHLLGRRVRSLIPIMTVIAIPVSLILQSLCPNDSNFLFLMASTTVYILCSLSRLLSLVILSFNTLLATFDITSFRTTAASLCLQLLMSTSRYRRVVVRRRRSLAKQSSSSCQTLCFSTMFSVFQESGLRLCEVGFVLHFRSATALLSLVTRLSRYMNSISITHSRELVPNVTPVVRGPYFTYLDFCLCYVYLQSIQSRSVVRSLSSLRHVICKPQISYFCYVNFDSMFIWLIFNFFHHSKSLNGVEKTSYMPIWLNTDVFTLLFVLLGIQLVVNWK